MPNNLRNLTLALAALATLVSCTPEQIARNRQIDQAIFQSTAGGLLILDGLALANQYKELNRLNNQLNNLKY